MILQKFKTPGIAHVAYLIGDAGEAAIVDPHRDIAEYQRAARENDLTLKYVVLTHRQEDFVLGSGALREGSGAKVVAGSSDLFGKVDVSLKEGEELSIGGLRLKALHTPGHTPESMSYAVYVDDTEDLAWGVFTGDALFIGETGRTDLPDPEKTGENAELLYRMIHEKILPLGDQVILLPAHGSGSVCGGNIADRDHSTLGLERVSNPIFKMTSQEFRKHKEAERIPRPPYFNYMEEVNSKGGKALPFSPESVKILAPDEFKKRSQKGVVIDARPPEAFAGAHVPGSINVWLEGLPVFGGWVADHQTPIYLILESMSQAEEAILHLLRIGNDRIEGILSGGFEAWRDEGLPIESSGTISPEQLARKLRDTRGAENQKLMVLDVREITEFESGHISQAQWEYAGDIARSESRQKALASHSPVVVTCSVGHRAGLVASLLRKQGCPEVYNLLGGMTAWSKLKLPEQKSEDQTDKAA